MQRAIVWLLCAALLAGLCSGCSSGKIIRMDIAGPVENLDPQFATDPTARMILANLLEGLVVKGADGELRPGAAERWEVSDDGLTYTFTLRDDAHWEKGEAVTARHFAFAMERLFSPDAPSPFAADYAVIEGGEEILAGEAALKSLGVTAPDDRTVVFRLRRPSAVFLALLAATPAMPCHEETFEASRGRYGLELQYVYANGPFLLDRWDNTRYLYLTPNTHYRDGFTALPSRVTFYVGREDPLSQFEEGKSDLILLSAGDLEQLTEDKVRLMPMDRTVWCIVFNGGKDAFRNALLRQALAMTVDRNAYAAILEDHPNYTSTEVLVPPDMQVGGVFYRKAAGSRSPMAFDPGRGAELYRLALDTLEIGRLPQTVLHLPESGVHPDCMGVLQQNWQQYLDVHIVLEPNTNSQLEARLRSGDYRMMLMPFTPAAENPAVLLGAFRAGSAQNYFGYENTLFDRLVAEAQNEATAEGAVARCKAAEDLLLGDACVIPVYFETSSWALAEGVTGVEISAFGGQILFANADKA